LYNGGFQQKEIAMAKIVLTFTDNDDGTFALDIQTDTVIDGPEAMTPAVRAATYALVAVKDASDSLVAS